MGGGAWPFLVGGGLLAFSQWKFEAITGVGNLLKLHRDGDRALQLLLFNEESLVSGSETIFIFREVGQTWSFRGSKSRNKVSVGEPAEGSLKIYNRELIFPDYLYSNPTLYKYINYTKTKLKKKTFNNGSLGSRIDEERSEMRYVLKQEYPLNLSISISGGKETNKDSPKTISVLRSGSSSLEQDIMEGENPVHDQTEILNIRSLRVELFGNAAQNGETIEVSHASENSVWRILGLGVEAGSNRFSFELGISCGIEDCSKCFLACRLISGCYLACNNILVADGELCLNRVKPEETLVEARSGSDVQIDRRIWVKRMIRGLGVETALTYSQTLNIARIHAHFDTTKGVSSSRQQDGGHGSRNPLRKVMGVSPDGTALSADLGDSSKYSNENFED
ncbi:4335_t:CDS:10 [Diversispora eburnea]|uniref:4335_t:CDS:1 n=1 Tax=Diversispora eburnea TaxID=1213867 RepID=A0A9N9CNC3_9GLOM|nr:4335_t:CDS:10 [Diversispora eburnea]